MRLFEQPTHNSVCYSTAVNDLVTSCRRSSATHPDPNGANVMSRDNDWWSWVVIGTLFLLTMPATYVPIARAIGLF